MNLDWDGLRTAIRMERARRDWTQGELAERAGVSVTTLKNVEGARAYQKPPVAVLQAIDLAFEWPRGSLEGVLRKELAPAEEPTAASAPAPLPPLPAPLPPLKDRLPLRVRLDLENSEIVDADRYDLTVGNGARIIAFLLVDQESPANPHDHVELRRAWREWERIKRIQRGLPPLPWEPGDPEEWKTDSEG